MLGASLPYQGLDLGAARCTLSFNGTKGRQERCELGHPTGSNCQLYQMQHLF